MNNQINDGGPAYPIPGVYDPTRQEVNPVDAYYNTGGMSLRQYYAAMAMQAMVEKVVFDQPTEDLLIKKGIKVEDFEKFTAHIAFSMADAMIRHEQKEKESNEQEV